MNWGVFAWVLLGGAVILCLIPAVMVLDGLRDVDESVFAVDGNVIGATVLLSDGVFRYLSLGYKVGDRDTYGIRDFVIYDYVDLEEIRVGNWIRGRQIVSIEDWEVI